MSGSGNEITNSSGPASGGEPSMEEILASIRRILKDDPQVAAGAAADGQEEELLVLDASMIVNRAPAPEVPGAGPAAEFPLPRESRPAGFAPIEAVPEAMPPEPMPPAPPHLASPPIEPDFPAGGSEVFDLPAAPTEALISFEPPSSLPDPAIPGSEREPFMPDENAETLQPPPGLIGEAAGEAAARSIGSLIRSIGSERAIAIGRPGLTLEDIVREELRPLLKSWLDSNLPSLVERIVRSEIQRVVERTGI